MLVPLGDGNRQAEKSNATINRESMPGIGHRQHKWLDNQAKNPHQQMKRVKRPVADYLAAR